MLCSQDRCLKYYGLECSTASECYDGTPSWATSTTPNVTCDTNSKTCCSPEGGYCDSNAYNDDPNKYCCGSLICDEGYGGGTGDRCCKGAGETCTLDPNSWPGHDCCGSYHECDSNNRCCINASSTGSLKCTSDQDCCNGRECEPVQPHYCCISSGEDCTFNQNDCCSGKCNTGKCCPNLGDACTSPQDCCADGHSCGTTVSAARIPRGQWHGGRMGMVGIVHQTRIVAAMT